MLRCFSAICVKSIHALEIKLKLYSQHMYAAGDMAKDLFLGVKVTLHAMLAARFYWFCLSAFLPWCALKAVISKTQTTIQISIVLMAVRNQMLHYVKFHFCFLLSFFCF